MERDGHFSFSGERHKQLGNTGASNTVPAMGLTTTYAGVTPVMTNQTNI